MKFISYSFLLFFFLFFSGCVPKWEGNSVYNGDSFIGYNESRRISVSQGDSVYSISRKYGVPMRSIIETNNLAPPYILVPNQVLILQAPNSYSVKKGDSLYSISKQFGSNLFTIARLNSISPPYTIFPGQILRIPNIFTVSNNTPETNKLNLKKRLEKKPIETKKNKNSLEPKQRDITLGAKENFLWPVKGEVMSKFGPAGKGLHNDGINISVPEGTEVLAAQSGTVAYSGNELQGFGNLLLIKHSDGWMTAYAHNSLLMVSRGDEVRRGQIISRAGSSGNVSTPQLHFEIRRGTKAVDPLKYL